MFGSKKFSKNISQTLRPHCWFQMGLLLHENKLTSRVKTLQSGFLQHQKRFNSENTKAFIYALENLSYTHVNNKRYSFLQQKMLKDTEISRSCGLRQAASLPSTLTHTHGTHKFPLLYLNRLDSTSGGHTKVNEHTCNVHQHPCTAQTCEKFVGKT